MGKDPAVLFYTSDFLTGTSRFTMEQRGQYIYLLCDQHQNGHIPEDHMLFICKSCDSPVFKKFVKDEDGLYYNERMEEEHQKRVAFSKSRSLNKKGKTKKQVKITRKSYDKHMENENENENKDGIETGNKKKSNRFDWKNWLSIEGNINGFEYLKDEEFLNLFNDRMGNKKVTKTEKAMNAALKKLHAVDIETAKSALLDAIDGGYQGVFPKQPSNVKPFLIG